ncbi:oxidoreductase [Winogradskyella eckloniae]|uniref:WD40/YVTN/BNR-like repeat-containing protein n=1 Tax=Winogradskyella eckloniae TaxID=1089306 RepID=UPI00156319B6|nr:oxidoreductase [Winogradskyella eckloniae]NRD19743.1 oxidoreductase [Winogradskyella eckloniae]
MNKLFLNLVIAFVSIGIGSFCLNIFNNNFDTLNTKRKTVSIETLVEDSTLNVRAIDLVKKPQEFLVYLTSRGEFGVLLPKYFIEHVDSLSDLPFYNHKINLSKDSLKLNFRAMAIRDEYGYGITIGNPAMVYSLDADLEKNKVVYQENHPKVFYDSMDFWNDQEGIAIGDPTDDCMSVIITRDGGNTWTKLSCEELPKAKEGEAAFAASDTNIAIVGDHTWVATGGKASRIIYSSDKGKTWEVFETPIIQGKETTGMYSVDFYDEKNGFAIGGDYTKPNATINNKIRTHDGGKTWQVVANGIGPGYRSCVQYIPNSKGKELVAIGFKGIDYSSDAGNSWQHLSDEGFYTIRFANDSVAYAAGKGRISKLTFRE